MPGRGPAPTPIETRLRNGNPSKRPIPSPVVVGGRLQPGETVPQAPRHLSPDARRAWREIVGMLAAAGIYDRADAMAVENAAGLLVRLRQARSVLDELAAGRMQVRGRKSETQDVFIAPSVRGMVRNPVASHEVELSNALRQALGELGLSPAGRTRIGGRTTDRPTLVGMRAGVAKRAGGA